MRRSRDNGRRGQPIGKCVAMMQFSRMPRPRSGGWRGRQTGVHLGDRPAASMPGRSARIARGCRESRAGSRRSAARPRARATAASASDIGRTAGLTENRPSCWRERRPAPGIEQPAQNTSSWSAGPDLVEIDQDRVETRAGRGDELLRRFDGHRLGQGEPAAGDRGDGLVGIDQGRGAIRQ